MALKITPQYTHVLATMDLEREEMKIKLKHPSVQTLPSGSQAQDLDVSLDLNSVPLADKVNLHKQVGEMLYNDINKHQITIDRAQIYIDKIAEKVSVEKVKSCAIFQHKGYYKELIMKMGIDPEDDTTMETVQ